MRKLIANNKKIFLGIIIGVLCSSVTVYAAYSYLATDVSFTPGDENWEVTNVEEALNDLYVKNNTSSEEKFITAYFSNAQTNPYFTTPKVNNLNLVDVEGTEVTFKKSGTVNYIIKTTGHAWNPTTESFNFYAIVYINDEAVLTTPGAMAMRYSEGTLDVQAGDVMKIYHVSNIKFGSTLDAIFYYE